MTLTLLLDLDDTLLTNQIDQFLNGYLQAWGTFIAEHVAPELFVKQLLVSTQDMLQNDNPGRTLEEAFDITFYPAIGIQKESLRNTLDRFYAEVFPTLRGMTSPRPEAVRLVDRAVERGYRLAVATNPLFPRTAIEQRLDWAGLPPERYPFEIITSYETFHYAKPNPAYFSEILAQLGWPSEPAVMVGNSLDDDILPARRAGIHAYLLVNGSGYLTSEEGMGIQSGSMRALFDWLEELEPGLIQPRYDEPAAILAALKGSAAALDRLTRRLPEPAWCMRPQPGEWNLTQILCHLRDVEREVNLERVALLASEKNPFIPGIDTDAWADERDYHRQDGPQALSYFLEARIELLVKLAELGDGVWEHKVRHAIFGPTTVRELVGFMATHDRNHLRQVHETVVQVKDLIS